MGAYVNPKNESKESFLAREGKRVVKLVAREHRDFTENFVVALVDNGPFTAAGIAFNSRELAEWTANNEPRPMKFFIVPKDKLLEVSNLKDYVTWDHRLMQWSQVRVLPGQPTNKKTEAR